jgi:hypothetical protein
VDRPPLQVPRHGLDGPDGGPVNPPNANPVDPPAPADPPAVKTAEKKLPQHPHDDTGEGVEDTIGLPKPEEP